MDNAQVIKTSGGDTATFEIPTSLCVVDLYYYNQK
jgi:hypothetical protein